MNIKIRNKEIDIISFILTILVAIVVIGVGILWLLKVTGIINHDIALNEKNRYILAEETIYKYVLSYRVDCLQNKTETNIDEMLQIFLESENVVIRKCYTNVDNENEIVALAVNAKKYNDYVFLIGESCKIAGVAVNEVPENYLEISSDANSKGFIQISKYQEKILGPDYDTTPKTHKALISIPVMSNETVNGEEIEVTTQMAINRFSQNTLKIDNVKNTKFTLIETTTNLILREKELFALSTANEDDYCKIDITGIYNNKKYTNHLIISVKPENVETVIKDIL